MHQSPTTWWLGIVNGNSPISPYVRRCVFFLSKSKDPNIDPKEKIKNQKNVQKERTKKKHMEPSPSMGPPANMSGIQKLQLSLIKNKWIQKVELSNSLPMMVVKFVLKNSGWLFFV